MAGSHPLPCPDGVGPGDATPTIISNFGLPAVMSRFGASANNNGPSVSPTVSFHVPVDDAQSREAVAVPSRVSSLRLSMQIQLVLSDPSGASSQRSCPAMVSSSATRRSFERSTDSVLSHPVAVIQSPDVMGTPPDPRSGSVRFVAFLSSFSTAMSCPSAKSPVQPSAMCPLTASNAYSTGPRDSFAEERPVS